MSTMKLIPKALLGRPILYNPPENSSFVSELDWSPESWFSKRVAKPDGTYYNADEAARLASHVPEYYNIEQTSKQNGTWLKMDDGSTWEGDPRAWVMMQSQAYRRNYSPKPWYTGQAEWPTQFDYPGDKKGAIKTNKVTRAPYYNGQMWFSNDKTYGDAFSYYYASTGEGMRQSIPEEANVLGHTFLSAIPKKGIYRKLAAPKPGTADVWDSMPYFLQNGHIYREKPSNISTTQDFKYVHNTRKDGKKVLTDDVVNWSRDLGDQGIFLHQVDDGQGIKFSGDVIDILKRYSEGRNAKKRVKKSEFQFTYPILEEFISQPGFTDKVKFIEGNTGDFDINNPYKYAENVLDNDSSQDTVHYAALGSKLKLIPKALVGIQLQPTNHYFVAPDITIDNTRVYTPMHNEPTPKIIPREQIENFQNIMNHEFRERVLKKSPERFDPEAVKFNNLNGLYMWGALIGLKMLKKVPNAAWKSSLRGAALEAVTTVIDKQLQDADLITIENFLKKHPSLDRFLSYTGDIAGTLGSLAADAPDSKSRKAAKLLMLYGQIVDGIQGGASIHNMVENGVNLDDVFNTVVGVLPSTWNDTGVGIDDAVRNVSQGLGITNDVYQDVKNSNEETRRKLGK